MLLSAILVISQAISAPSPDTVSGRRYLKIAEYRSEIEAGGRLKALLDATRRALAADVSKLTSKRCGNPKLTRDRLISKARQFHNGSRQLEGIVDRGKAAQAAGLFAGLPIRHKVAFEEIKKAAKKNHRILDELTVVLKQARRLPKKKRCATTVSKPEIGPTEGPKLPPSLTTYFLVNNERCQKDAYVIVGTDLPEVVKAGQRRILAAKKGMAYFCIGSSENECYTNKQRWRLAAFHNGMRVAPNCW